MGQGVNQHEINSKANVTWILTLNGTKYVNNMKKLHTLPIPNRYPQKTVAGTSKMHCNTMAGKRYKWSTQITLCGENPGMSTCAAKKNFSEEGNL